MAEAEFPSNSKHPAKKAAPAKKAVEKVIAGEAVVKKQTLGGKVKEQFVRAEAKVVAGYVLFDVIIPAVKDLISDSISQGADRMLFGDSSRSRGRSKTGEFGRVAYNRMSQSSPPWKRDSRAPSHRARATHDFDEIVLATRDEADTVIDRLFDLVSQYEVASVADLYDLVGATSNYTDQKWGWTDLRGAGVSRVRSGYLLDLPRPEPLD